MEKDFASWHELKSELHFHAELPLFKQREIWWCSIGANVGHESDGKSRYFSRPVLVVRKFNKHIFLGVPLTTQIKASLFYHRISLHGKEQCVMLSQFRILDSKRLRSRLGWLSKGQFNEVREALRTLI